MRRVGFLLLLALTATGEAGATATSDRAWGAAEASPVPPLATSTATATDLATPADRAALAEVLARPEFHARRFDGRDLRRRLLAWWDDLMAALGTAEAERYASLGRVAFFLAAAVVLLLVRRSFQRRQGRGTQARAPGDAGAAARALASAARPEEAVEALARGDLVGAVRAAFASSAATLLPPGRRPDGPSLTGPELVAATGDGRLADLARLHDRTLFGRRPVTPEEARRAVDAALSIAASPHRPAGTGP